MGRLGAAGHGRLLWEGARVGFPGFGKPAGGGRRGRLRGCWCRTPFACPAGGTGRMG